MGLKKSISSNHLLSALEFISKKLNQIDYFVFYGTLLGLVRDGKPIDGDDDVDIMVPRVLREELLLLLTSDPHDGVVYDSSLDLNKTPYFMQIRKAFDGVDVLIDFYLFDLADGWVMEKWTGAAWASGVKPLSIPAELIFPIKSISCGGNILKSPAYAEACCELVYGRTWKFPKRKNVHYETYLEDGVLKRRRASLKSRLLVFFPVLYEIKLIRSVYDYFRI